MNDRRMNLWITLLSACLLLGAAASLVRGDAAASAPPPATGPGKEPRLTSLQSQVLQKVQKDADAMKSPRPEDRQAARQELVAVFQNLYQAMAGFAANEDPEVRARAKELQAQWLMDVHLAEAMAVAGVKDRAGFEKLCTANGRGIEQFLNGDQQSAMQLTADVTGEAALEQIEPLLAAVLRLGQDVSARVAANYVQDGSMKSDALVDALTSVVLAQACSRGQRDRLQLLGNYDNAAPWAASALRTIASSRPTPALLAAMVSQPSEAKPEYRLAQSLLAAALGSPEARAVPVLMEKVAALPASQPTTTVAQFTAAQGDAYLYAVATLSGQDAKAYNLTVTKMYQTMGIGFVQDADRLLAVAKIQQWWAEAKKQPAYKDLAPLKVPSLAEALAQYGLAVTTEPAPAGAGSANALSISDDLHATILEAVKQQAQGLGSPRATSRQAAQDSLRAFHKAMLEAVGTPADAKDSSSRREVCDVLARIGSECRFQQLLTEMDKDRQASLRRAWEEAPDLAASVFGLSHARALRAAWALAQREDPKALFEPLVILCLESRYVDMQIATVDGLELGPNKSDTIVDALAKGLDRPQSFYNWYYHGMPGMIQMPSPLPGMARTLVRIGTPKALSALVSTMLARQEQDPYRMVAFAKMLVATGDKRIVALLMDALPSCSKNTILELSPAGGQRITGAASDIVLWTIVKLSGQKTEEYGMKDVSMGPTFPQAYGFESAKDRSAAIEKAATWWQESKDKAPYKDLKPLPPVTKPKPPEE